MSVAKHIPNTITLGNVFCGCMSVVYASSGDLVWASYFIFIGALFDFGDGLAARALKVQSEMGKQLDSLADMLTFGFAPGFLVYSAIAIAMEGLPGFEHSWQSVGPENGSLWVNFNSDGSLKELQAQTGINWIALSAFLLPMFSALRLAKFNVDESQSTEFKGLATPANALFWAGTVLALSSLHYGASGFQLSNDDLWGLNRSQRYLGWHTTIYGTWMIYIAPPLIAAFSLLLVAPVRMFSFKFKNMSWTGNEIRFVFIGIALLVFIGALLIKNIFVSIPIIILLYIITSMINNLIRK